MAKVFKIEVKKEDFNNVIANQEFNTLVASNQVGDKFFVPEESALLVLGTSVPMRNSEGIVRLDDEGKEMHRSAAQHFPVVRLIDGKPSSVVELYVGQLVKVDINRKIVFNNELASALRKGSEAFKELICNKCLEITEDTICQDRDWDNEANAYKRDDGGKYIPVDKRVFNFEVKRSALNAEDTTAAYDMLQQYYKEMYAEYVETK